MDLQNFIDTTPEYIKEFKKNKLYIRNYSDLGLLIVKCYHNQKYNYNEKPWLRYCRGAIIDTKKNKLDSKFISYDEIIEKLVVSKLKCHYCCKDTLMMYENNHLIILYLFFHLILEVVCPLLFY